jgi:hypothetical protein
MDWLTRRIHGGPAAQLPLPPWMRRPVGARSRQVERSPLAHGTLILVEDQDGPVISIALRR